MATNTSLVYAAQLRMTIKRGDASVVSVTFTNPNDGGNPLNLSGFDDLTMQVRLAPTDPDVLLTLTQGDGLDVSGDDNEILTITFDDGGGLGAERTYVYDVQGLINTSDPRTILEGTIKVESDVTRA